MGEVIKNDVPALARWVAAQKIGLIVFDGFPGAGKTTLAKDLAGRLRCRTVDADLFLEKKRDMFVEALRLPELAAEIRIAMELSRFVLFSSTCAREVADRIGFGAKAFVYVLLLTPEGEVNEKYALQAEDEFDLAELEGEGLSPLDIEVRKYHWNRKPRQTADVIYERTDEYVLPPL